MCTGIYAFVKCTYVIYMYTYTDTFSFMLLLGDNILGFFLIFPMIKEVLNCQSKMLLYLMNFSILHTKYKYQIFKVPTVSQMLHKHVHIPTHIHYDFIQYFLKNPHSSFQ